MEGKQNIFQKFVDEINRVVGLRVPISTKITLPYGFLALVVALGGAYLITQVIISSIEKRFDDALAETKEITADLVVHEENRLLETLRLIAFLDGLENEIRQENSEELREKILPIVFNNTEDAVEILNIDGENLLSIRRDLTSAVSQYQFEKGGDELSDFPFVQNVFLKTADEEGDKFAGLVPANNSTYLYVAGPIKDSEGNLIGVVMVGKSIKDLLVEFRAQTLSQVTIYDFDGEVFSSTLIDPPSIDSDIVRHVIDNQNQETINREFTISDIGYKENLSTWEIRNRTDYGLLGIASQTKYISETAQATRQNIFLLVAFTLFIVLIVGISIARLITKPIHNLRDAALEVSSGNLQVQVDPVGEDEISLLTNTFNDMVRNLDTSKKDLISAYDRTLEGWSKALELRDKETEGHTQRVTDWTLKLATAHGIGGEELENMRRGALLHDIGKVGISDNILHKPGKLTDEEFAEIKKHPDYAYDMLSEISFLHDAIDIPYCHHEKWDGTGYPRGLKGEDIPLAARLFSIADVWDAITTDRPYRKAMPLEKAFSIINEGKGTHFDPMVVDLFYQILEKEGYPVPASQ
jgi:HD-GYP domain-containing protein (c-di-GMP phosphodiesterase class II)